ncbi:MAG: hypothetical protein HKO72_02080 [Flavobacteriaceae bacterium]|nr:hypothetical protein [Bacteroidia bacterium]NNL60106.1 hypothetical protein [Flavobacteriaceae bacterium]
MKTHQHTQKTSGVYALIVLFVLSAFSVNGQVILTKKDSNKPETDKPADIYWHVKAFRPEAKLLRIKAIDKEGNYHDVKAIQDSDDTSILNVKALVDGERLPIKMIVKGANDRFYPVKAIAKNGTLVDIKAITEDGEIMGVKGFSRSGNIINLRAITKNNRYYNVIAISPQGKVNAVKGIKMFDSEEEAVINGVSIYAHIKAIHQD